MFNRTVLVGGSTTHHHTTIKQQPHDAADAARLYGELERKAEAEIKSAICKQLEGISAQYAELHVYREPMHMKDIFFVCFRVNGKEVKAKIEVQDWETTQDRDRFVVRKVAEGITDAVLEAIAPTLFGHRRFA